jgi:hypothetical protein
MEATIRLLEDRVQRLLRRLKDLSAERSGLASENRAMKARLAEFEGKGAGTGWPMPPERVASELRDAIRELSDP